MRFKKGDLFSINVDAYVADKVASLPLPYDEKSKQADEALRGLKLRVHRIEQNGTVLIYESANGGFTGVKSKFCNIC